MWREMPADRQASAGKGLAVTGQDQLSIQAGELQSLSKLRTRHQRRGGERTLVYETVLIPDAKIALSSAWL